MDRNALLDPEEAEEWWTWLARAEVLLMRLGDRLETWEEQVACKETARQIGRIARRVAGPPGA